jgi:hypothetical protein
MAIDKNLLNSVKQALQKSGFVPPPNQQAAMMGGGPGMPMGEAAAGGMMPPGMDPSMMGGMPPGMDPSMMDPAMMGGEMPPPVMPPEEDPVVKKVEVIESSLKNTESRLQSIENTNKQILDKLNVLTAEVPHVKAGKDDTILHAIRKLISEH